MAPYIVREQPDFEPTTKSLEPPVLRLLKFGTLYQAVGTTFSTKVRLHFYSVDPHAYGNLRPKSGAEIAIFWSW